MRDWRFAGDGERGIGLKAIRVMPRGPGGVIIRVARGLVRLAEPLLIMAALFAAPIVAKEISRGRAITD
jgi:hypothetical protein